MKAQTIKQVNVILEQEDVVELVNATTMLHEALRSGEEEVTEASRNVLVFLDQIANL